MDENEFDAPTMKPVGDLVSNIVKRIDDLVWMGKPITTPGVYSHIPIEDYHYLTTLFDGFSISGTGIKQVLDRPLAYWAFSPFNEKRYEKETTQALSFGKAAHALILGDEDFTKSYAVKPTDYLGKKWNGNRTDCKQWVAKKQEQHRTIISESELDTVTKIAEALGKKEAIKLGLLNGKIERTVCAVIDGIWVKTRPDVLPASSGDVVDLKTASALDDDSLNKSIYNFGYHIQAGISQMVFREVYGPEYFQSFSFVFVESKAPFDVRIKQLDQIDIDKGEAQARLAVRVINKCLERNEWPGYDGFSQDISWVGNPTWARTRIQTQLDQESA